jgi:predicted 3-demethylubiquinone-9 3-methyltransferase (glyoxalase superfamily)
MQTITRFLWFDTQAEDAMLKTHKIDIDEILKSYEWQ